MSAYNPDESLMGRALELARRGEGFVEPNPMVGAVLVSPTGEPIAEGWHQRFGGPHAEVNCLRAAGERARGGTLYVTLEPCCHHGKTPPCTAAVIAAGVAKVIVATPDPAPHVAGGGIRQLREADIDVEVGLCEDQARELIAPFVTLQTLGRPFVHAKWAMTLDGKIASRTRHSQWISNEYSRARVHELRGRVDGILVGIGTALADDPLLSARPEGPRTAARVVLDARGRLPLDCRLTHTIAEAPLYVATTESSLANWRTELHQRGAELLMVRAVEGADGSTSDPPQIDLLSLCQTLGGRGWTNLLVEGGGETLGSFFDTELIDEAHIFIGPKLVGGRDATTPFAGQGLDRIPELSQLRTMRVEQLDGDIYVCGRMRR